MGKMKTFAEFTAEIYMKKYPEKTFEEAMEYIMGPENKEEMKLLINETFGKGRMMINV